MDRLDRFDLAYQRFCGRLVTFGIGLLLLAMVLGVSVNVFARYVFRQPILGLYTYIGLMLVPATFFGLAFGWYNRGTFVTVNVIQNRLRGKALWIGQFLVFLVAAVAWATTTLYGVTTATWMSFTTRQYVGETGYLSPAWPWKFMMVVGMLMVEARIILDLVQMVRKRAIIPFNRKSTE